MKGEGLTAGVSDLIIMRPGRVRGYDFHSVVIEIKRSDRTGKVSTEQRAFLKRRRETGSIAELCHGHHETLALIWACYGW